MYDNLEIFILTYNRDSMLKDTLKSVCEQSAEGFDIIVADNASDDKTATFVNEIKQLYPKRNIRFESVEKNIGGPNNFNRVIEMAKKEWTMIFHDDDLIHPEYIKTAMDLLKKNPEAVIASCTFKEYENPALGNWENFSNRHYLADLKRFAALMFGPFLQNFASCIYKTSVLKQHSINDNLYGKIADRPFMLEIAKHGKTIILKDAYIRYKHHAGQDTNDFDSGPFAPQWFALMNCYKQILGNSWFDKFGISYNIFVQSKLKMGYYWIKSVNSNMSFKEFKKMAVNEGLIRKTEVAKLFEKVCKILTPLIFNLI